MRSLNERWDSKQFHRRIAGLAGIASGDVVLDLGCGRGASLPHLVERVGPTGRVVAFDRSEAALLDIKNRFAVEAAPDVVEFVHGDLKDALPFADESFDAVVCQNVLECVVERRGVITECRRILRGGGRLLVGHHDFDGVMLASSDHQKTRRLLQAFADHTQEWQDTSESRMGRLLPGLFHGMGFAAVETETVLFVDLNLDETSYAHAYLDWVCDVASKLGHDRAELQVWRDELAARNKRGSFYFAVPWVYVRARKNEGEH